ncbi:MAG: hypothetical protein IKZ86_13735 [Spirochaetaceae bacterium]|nr:hypothetical protein [Spirochaetaceae bacterium]
MKLKKYACILLLAFIIVFSLFSEERLGRTVRKEVIVDDKKVNKRLRYDCLKEYDISGNLIHYKKFKNAEWWYEYDSDGNMIHKKCTSGVDSGFEHLYEYDSHGNMVRFKYFSNGSFWDGYETGYEYDSNGKLTYSKDSRGWEKWYDSNENEIYTKTPNGLEFWYEYDSDGNKVYYKCEYNGNYHHCTEEWNEYDSNGNMIYSKDSSGDEKWYEYDLNGNLIYSKETFRKTETWRKYDSAGNEIYVKRVMGKSCDEFWCEYDYYPSGEIKRKRYYSQY